VDRFLRDLLRRHRLSTICNNGLEPLYTDLTEFVGRKGKRIRPLLFLITHRTLNTRRDAVSISDLTQVAAALELFHAFILVHDDVIDRSETRRGKPTLHKMMERRMGFTKDSARTGVNVSIVMGDLLFAMACETILKSRFPSECKETLLGEFLNCVADTGVGEIYDILHSSREINRVSSKDIENTYFLKTTKYTFECPVVLGAKLAGASEQATRELRLCTHPIGLAFQIQNDLIEFQSRQSRDGSKLFLDDLFEGKKTMLLRHAYDRVGRIDRLFLQTCFDAKRLTDEAVQRIRQLVVQSGAFRDLQRKVDSLFDDAKQLLKRSSLSQQQQRQFQDLVKYLYEITLANDGAPQ